MSPLATATPFKPNHSMDPVVHEAQMAFRSARLKYIKIDEADEHVKAFLPQVEGDPVVLALASPALLRPRGKKELDWYAEQQTKAYLGVAICLVPSEGVQAACTPDGDSTGDKKDEREKPTIIGTMCLGWGGIPASTAHHRTASIGITLSSAHQNRGYGREAINWMLDWAFKHGAMHTVSICAYSYNERGAHLYEDIGFQPEGRRREVVWFNRKWYDELWFGMTEHEWEKLRGMS
ncbi:SPBc2 prophage-derived uncharacterized N-acetyltransferase YokL [Tolypocladium ophioglossoides CBS 100239]|uniref:SPBc2 prophage-derived uncharacterized N-acetyltransferase YokL n=1 Tax=Tolypocladium ophioglossoides (strain CBS 100239) TaxID=1163406 RepID=A0A0L0NFY1_TOLOC|nr:SPBc2 prophage-derived uncharacterized N-acetyltransferase YokL [Tolypocladium ophioglossoides CBS 100239]